MKRILLSLLLVLAWTTGAWAAQTASAILEIRAAGSTNNGGFFDPGQTLESVDLACTVCNTDSPVVTSATYTFAAGDDEHWIYIKAGTNWTPGWYQIASVAAGAATLRAAVGEAIQGTAPNLKLNTVAGCATVATQDANFGTFAMDYSQADAAIDSGTDLASADGDVNPCVVTSASHNFVDAEIGNSIHITEAGDGFTLGRYVITSTNGTAATLDRACGSDGAKTGGDWYLGGAADLGAATSDSEMFAQLVAGNSIFILGVAGDAVDYTASEAIVGTAGAAATPITFKGYITSRATIPTGTDRPKIDLSTFAFSVTTGSWDIRNIIFTGATETVTVTINGSSYMENCSIANTTATADKTALIMTSGSLINNCEVTNVNGVGVNAQGTNRIYYSYIHDCKTGISLTTAGNHIIIGNIVDTCTVYGINTGTRSDVEIIGNTLYGANHATADGINSATNAKQIIMNNLIVDWNVGVIGTGPILVEKYNAFYSNDTNIAAGINATSFVTTASPWVGDPAAGDFRVTSELEAKGFPGNSIIVGTAATSKGYSDIGALQRIEPTSTGGGAWSF